MIWDLLHIAVGSLSSPSLWKIIWHFLKVDFHIAIIQQLVPGGVLEHLHVCTRTPRLHFLNKQKMRRPKCPLEGEWIVILSHDIVFISENESPAAQQVTRLHFKTVFSEKQYNMIETSKMNKTVCLAIHICDRVSLSSTRNIQKLGQSCLWISGTG